MHSTDQSTAIDKALDVLFHLHAEDAPQGVSAIGRALDMPKSSAHRLLSTLRRRQLVEQDESGRYRPGIALLALGLGVLAREPLVVAGRAVLEAEAASLGETFFLVDARDGRLVVLEKVEGTGLLRVSPPVGSEVPVHATAVGKLYLAHAPELVRTGETTPFTEHTLRSEVALAREVEQAGSDGYAQNRQEWLEGLSVIAAPIFLRGEITGAICVALPSTRLAQLEDADVIERVKRAAREIEARMGGPQREAERSRT